MSFLRSEGHFHASRYSLAFMWNEVEFARNRNNARIVTEATVMQAAISALLVKEGSQHFKEITEQLNGRQ